MKRHYSDFVRHCLRSYIATLEVGAAPKFKTAAEKANWMSCHEVVPNLDARDLEFVKELYSAGDTIPDKIFGLARDHKIAQSYFWTLIDDLEYKIAQKRGMI